MPQLKEHFNFDFNDPNGAGLMANYFHEWKEILPATLLLSSSRRARGSSGVVDALMSGEIECTEGLALLYPTPESIQLWDEDRKTRRKEKAWLKLNATQATPATLQLWREDRSTRRKEKARLRAARLEKISMQGIRPTHRISRSAANQSPEMREKRLKSHRASGAKYRAANRDELRRKEWRRRPG